MMTKRPFRLMLSAAAALLLLASCQETADYDEFHDWKSRNEAFIDSIATVCKANADGCWQRFLVFDRIDEDTKGNTAQWDNSEYVYCHVEAEGTGTESPFFTDSIKVNYRGRLIPSDSYPEGRVFDQTYKTSVLDPSINVPACLYMGSLVKGFTTAAQEMTEGDIWRIYIPASLAYRSSKKDENIPAYSALIFDLNLVKVIHN